MKVEHKAVPVSLFKVLDEAEGIVAALVSVTGVVDDVKDDIRPGAYAKTLASRTPKGVWSHDWDTPVSKTRAVVELLPGDPRLPKKQRNGEDWPTKAGGLLVDTQFNLNTQRGREAFEDVKFFGDEQEWSIGYAIPIGGSKINPKTGIREITEIELFEYSPVLFGAMPLTATASVKSAQEAFKVARKDAEERLETAAAAFEQAEAGEVRAAAEAEVAEAEKALTALIVQEGEKAGGDDPTDHDYVDENGDGKCDVCGMPEADHVAEKAGAEPEGKDISTDSPTGPSTPAQFGTTGSVSASYSIRENDEGKYCVVDESTDAEVECYDAKADAETRRDELNGAAKAATEAAEARKVAIDGVLAAFDVDEETRAKMADALAEKLAADVEVKAYVDLPGSYEERQTALWRYAYVFSPPESVEDPADEDAVEDVWFDDDDDYDWSYDPWWGSYRDWSTYTSIEATFDDRVVFAHTDYRAEPDEPQTRYFEVPYAWDAQAGVANITGTPREVAVSVSLAAKSVERAAKVRGHLKVGRVLSEGNADAITTAVGSLIGLLDEAGVTHAWSAAAEAEVVEAVADGEQVEAKTVTLDAAEVFAGQKLVFDSVLS